MPGRSGSATRLLVHSPIEVLTPSLGDVLVAGWNGPRNLLEHMEQDEESLRAPVQNAEEATPVVAAELPELPLDLPAVRKRNGGSVSEGSLRRSICRSSEACTRVDLHDAFHVRPARVRAQHPESPRDHGHRCTRGAPRRHGRPHVSGLSVDTRRTASGSALKALTLERAEDSHGPSFVPSGSRPAHVSVLERHSSTVWPPRVRRRVRPVLATFTRSDRGIISRLCRQDEWCFRHRPQASHATAITRAGRWPLLVRGAHSSANAQLQRSAWRLAVSGTRGVETVGPSGAGSNVRVDMSDPLFMQPAMPRKGKGVRLSSPGRDQHWPRR